MANDQEEEKASNQRILSKDLITFAKESSNFIDFRLQRAIMEGVKEKRIKSYKEGKVLSSLLRLLIFESTRLLSNPGRTEELVMYDIALHQKLSLGSLFCFNKMHVVTKGLFTFPAKSFFVFAHNQPISPD